jgi:hypothetical protein
MRERYISAISILGIGEVNIPLIKVNILPGQRENFPSSHACLYGKQNHLSKPWVRAKPEKFL